MATHVQVILRQDVDKLGRAGDLVRVRPGFARNYLLPRGIATAASSANVKQVEHDRRTALAVADKQRKVAEGSAAMLEGLTVDMPMKVGESDRLFGSVTTRDIADALARRGVTIDRKQLILPDAIKTLGEYTITAKVGQQVTATFRIKVVAG
jgi:large subunit ribosomal protein L9